jgi:hypothetical protein
MSTAPPSPSRTIAEFARVCPAAKLITDVSDRAVPDGHTVT